MGRHHARPPRNVGHRALLPPLLGLPIAPRAAPLHLPRPVSHTNSPVESSGLAQGYRSLDQGMQLSGNKIRKLEFLMADAKTQGADCVITIGGIQSNHCRATAVAARYLGLDCYLILRTSRTLVEDDPGLEGNLLVERLVGAHVSLVSKEEYVQLGSGGASCREIEGGRQEAICDSCGWLKFPRYLVHAYAVCDSPEYFYDYVQGLIDGLNAGVKSEDIVRVVNAKGLGYAMSSTEELKLVKEVAELTGVILDPVYSR